MKSKHELVWESCLKIIKDNISLQSFTTWFEPIKPIKVENFVLTIQVPSQFFYEWLEEHYVTLLRKTIKRELGDQAKLEYRVLMESKNAANTNPKTMDLPNNREGIYGANEVSLPTMLSTPMVKNPFVIPGLKKIHVDSQLNPNYLFETFIEGDCNKFARNAAKAVAKSPGGNAFNPLVIHGGTGLGKTHLAQAIGNFIKTNTPGKTVLYVGSEKFTTQFLNALREQSTNDFIHFYQQIDVLIIDDIHYLGNKAKTQDIFFHIFNHLHQNNKQLILTSDKAPKDLEGVEDRLLSRFKWGLTTDLQSPDYETRVSILRKKMHADGVEMSEDVVRFIATNIKNNVREIEGVVTSILAQATLNKQEINLDLAKRTVLSFVKHATKEISLEMIQKTVCDYFEVPVEKLKEPTRKRQFVQARQLSMYFAKEFTKASLKSIGQQFGGRDHSTVIHSCQAVKNLVDTDEDFKDSVDELRKRIELSL
ncbi:MAG TPA: chromosomal replication initiator protein DnaA [Chitinophagales bacterium]|nr:chromosomal replication initiator protein DnaA [Chitinophagales bacterium]MCB9075479.1 chromosomal replication initiator protein DnaA [Chitinophagales bacterium]HMU97760.1 chromosomal replication initiator protein DnaA [Chitinophagales bacterium]HMV03244.1 chromosomal replication initiator protein DnaA [Chitinophagales bacterium]HMW93270.1 chromosomal replication initiator protein DnaA [Chitinophagales bacterium]